MLREMVDALPPVGALTSKDLLRLAALVTEHADVLERTPELAAEVAELRGLHDRVELAAIIASTPNGYLVGP